MMTEMYEEHNSITAVWLKALTFLAVLFLIFIYFGLRKVESTPFKYNRYLEELPTSSRTIIDLLYGRSMGEDEQKNMIKSLIAYAKERHATNSNIRTELARSTNLFISDPNYKLTLPDNRDEKVVNELLENYYISYKGLEEELEALQQILPKVKPSQMAEGDLIRVAEKATVAPTTTPPPSPSPSPDNGGGNGGKPGQTATPPPGSKTSPTPNRTPSPGTKVTPSPSPSTGSPSPSASPSPGTQKTDDLANTILGGIGFNALTSPNDIKQALSGIPFSRAFTNPDEQGKGNYLALTFLPLSLNKEQKYLLSAAIAFCLNKTCYGYALIPEKLVPLVTLPVVTDERSGSVYFALIQKGEIIANYWPGPPGTKK